MKASSILAVTSLPIFALASLAQVPATPEARTLTQDFKNLPLAFEANRGQAGSDVEFLARGAGYNILLKQEGSDFLLRDRSGRKDVLQVKLVGASLRSAEGAEALEGRVNYLRGDEARWITGVPTYAQVKYAGVYPATDLVYYGNHGELEYDFVVHPGGAAKAIAMQVGAAKQVRVLKNGDLELAAASSSVVWHKPVAYQVANGKRTAVQAGYAVDGNTVRFRVGSYDRRRDLVIDPALAYSTYIGGSSDDIASAIAVDSTGHAYIAGETLSTDYPTTSGAYDRTCGTDGNCNNSGDGSVRDVFVTKLNTTGTGLVYSTYLGGSGYELAGGIAVDGSGNAVIVGETFSTDFATKALGPAASGNNIGAAFAVKLNSAGSGLVYAVRFGGTACSNGAGASGVKFDTSGNAVVTGTTDCSNFGTTSGSFQPLYHGAQPGTGGDAFIAKINVSGSAFVWASYLGGDQRDQANDVALDSSNNVYVTGYTSSRDFPVSSTAYLKLIPSNPGSSFLQTSAFVTKVSADGSKMLYSTYLGGTFVDNGNGIAVVGDNAIVTGLAQSKDFPTTSGVVQRTLKGLADAFVTRFNSTGSALVYSTLLGGSNDDQGTGIAVNSAGNAYVIGTTYSSNFPTTVYGFQRVQRVNGGEDDFVTELAPDGKSLVYSSYLGGSSFEEDQNFARITLDANRNVYAAGATNSADFPTTPGAYRTTIKSANGYDAWVAKISSICSLSTTNPSMTICQPTANATVKSPVQVEAGTFDLTPVRVIQVYVDGKKVYQAYLSAINIKLAMTAGAHRVTVQATDTANVTFKKTVNITVSP